VAAHALAFHRSQQKVDAGYLLALSLLLPGDGELRGARSFLVALLLNWQQKGTAKLADFYQQHLENGQIIPRFIMLQPVFTMTEVDCIYSLQTGLEHYGVQRLLSDPGRRP
jgi:hypothetical protein